MVLCKRLIARLDIKGSRLIKGLRFEGLRVLGDPCEAALRYSAAGADELLYLDAVASLYGRNSLSDLLRRTSRQIFIPITAGGAVRSVSDAAELLAAGADKVAVNTAALQNPELISDLASAFGSQCVVVSIQARRTGPLAWEAMAEAGRERSGKDVSSWITQIQELGAGEILITSVDQDGTCAGPDKDLQAFAAALARVPLVMSGGFACEEQVFSTLEHTSVSAVCIGAALHKNKLDLALLKLKLTEAEHAFRLRQPAVCTQNTLSYANCLVGRYIGIVDYGMGNQQSLQNALEMLGAEVCLSSDISILNKCELLALPGVGSFPQGMNNLIERGLDIFLLDWVSHKRPLIGICLGMQMFFESSEEFTSTPGLSLLEGRVVSLPSRDESSKPLLLPHIGWNSIFTGSTGFDPLSNSLSYQYFVHTYVASDLDPSDILFYSEYGGHHFVSAVQRESVIGFQFHPERGGSDGLALLALKCQELFALHYS